MYFSYFIFLEFYTFLVAATVKELYLCYNAKSREQASEQNKCNKIKATAKYGN
jgi:hypothetical protein